MQITKESFEYIFQFNLRLISTDNPSNYIKYHIYITKIRKAKLNKNVIKNICEKLNVEKFIFDKVATIKNLMHIEHRGSAYYNK